MREYGSYTGQDSSKSHQHVSTPAPESHRYSYSNLGARRRFLDEKYRDDLNNAKFWRQFTIISSGVGVGIIFLGAIGAIPLGLIAGPLVAGFVGGLSSLSGIVTNIFLHLVADPAGKANQQLEETCALILKEVQRDEDLQLLERLDEEDQKALIKQLIQSHIDSPETPLTRSSRGKGKKTT